MKISANLLLLIVSTCTSVAASVTSNSTGRVKKTFCVVPEHGSSGEVHRSSSTTGGAVEPCNETKTWNEYLARQQRYFVNMSDVTFLFHRGTHHMNRTLDATGINGLRLSGISPNDVSLISAVRGVSTPLVFTNFSDVTVEGMRIDLCATIGEEYLHNGLLYFSTGINATVKNTHLNNTCNGSEIYGERAVNMSFLQINITISKESSCGSLCLYSGISGMVWIMNSTFGVMSDNACNGDGTFSFLNFGRNLMFNTFVSLYNCSFTCANVIDINLASTSSLLMDNVKTDIYTCAIASADNCANYKNPLGISRVAGIDGTLMIINSTFRGCLGMVLSITKVLVYIYDSKFEESIFIGDISPDKLTGSALSLYDVRIGNLLNVTFSHNGISLYRSRNIRSNLPAVLVYISSIHIEDCNFTSSIGNALYSHLSNISFSGHNMFLGNIGYEGSAVYLYGTKIPYVLGSIVFESNVASHTGGALQITGINCEDPVCPFHSPLVENGASDTQKLTFLQNSAGTAGNDIYGGDLDQTIVNEGHNTSTHCIEVIRQFSILPNNLTSISSKPSRACLCNSMHEPDCLEMFSSREAYPGEDITISIVAVGQTFGTSAGFIYAQLLWAATSTSLGAEQHYQNVNQYSCNNLTYTIRTSESGVTILVLTATSEVVQDYLSQEDVDDSIAQYNKSHRSFVPQRLLNYPVFVNITIKQCPSGFTLSTNSPYKCVCLAQLLQIDGVKCHISSKQLVRSGTVWIGNKDHNGKNESRSSTMLFSKYCPNNYCNSSKVNIFNATDLQCQMGHTGRLCGQCPTGMSLTLGKPQCRNCSTKNLYLIAPLAIGGVVLVMFIKVTDLTTAGGLINGLILYANLVKAGGYMYFTVNSSYLEFLRVFIDWVNLDLGIETCFFNGLTGYWKTWLQFVFPLYIWTIALSLILLARYSIKVAHLIGNNSVPVLATLFALSYAKLFRVIITAIHVTELENAQNREKVTVWSYDGSIDYLEKRHIILLLAAVLVLLFLWLPYTCVLLFVQCLHRCSVRKVSRVISRLQPFLDAHCGPFKDKHRYWFGVLLVARAIPLLTGAFTPTNSEMVTTLSTIIVVGILLTLESQVYRKIYISISESLFLLNLLFLAGSALYTSSVESDHDQKVFTGVLIGIAFLHFIVIVVVSSAQHFRMFLYRRRRDPLLDNNTNTSYIDSLSYQRARSESDN